MCKSIPLDKKNDKIIHILQNGSIGNLSCHLKILQHRYNNLTVKNKANLEPLNMKDIFIATEPIYDIEFTEDYEFTTGEGEDIKYYTIHKGETGNLINIDNDGTVTIFISRPGEQGFDLELDIHDLRKITNIDEVLKDL